MTDLLGQEDVEAEERQSADTRWDKKNTLDSFRTPTINLTLSVTKIYSDKLCEIQMYLTHSMNQKPI